MLSKLFRHRRPTVMIQRPRPLRDEEAVELIRAGVIEPHEAPLALLRTQIARQNAEADR